MDKKIEETIVCPKCNGRRFVGKCTKSLSGSPNIGHRLETCPKCGGVGRLQVNRGVENEDNIT